ncbi:MAG: transcriptional repressor [Spirochaetaceae bacterium]|jgi:Fur family peroxide stress response transcriptional regulator|nr:transcriptional repressor [Spirochaetaceae bacterium]
MLKEMDFNRRRTKQRALVLETVHRLEHPTAQEIYMHIKNINRFSSKERISLGTIYRNLQVLEDEGKIISVPSGQDAMRYDAKINAHYHLLCVKCGRVVDLPVEYRHTLDFSAEKSSGCRIKSHSIMFKGVCTDCL